MSSQFSSVNTVGFCGKLPARGDFLRTQLPRDFVDGWDLWWQAMLTGSRARLVERWTEIWLQAPIWRFALAPGVCGGSGVLGLWLPSVDKAGRYFPLTIAAVALQHGAAPTLGHTFLNRAEQAGLSALEQDLPPDELLRALERASREPADDFGSPTSGAVWWTDGNALVQAGTLTTRCLPDATMFTAMIAGQASGDCSTPAL